jgi:hypothetical protein
MIARDSSFFFGFRYPSEGEKKKWDVAPLSDLAHKG